MDEGRRNLLKYDNAVDFIVTHCCSTSTEALISHGLYKPDVLTDYLEEIRQNVKFKKWLFGHYHADRVELPHVEQFYRELEPLDTIIERWAKYDETGELEWWLPLAPRMKRIMEGE
jgi:hypothetical protein